MPFPKKPGTKALPVTPIKAPPTKVLPVEPTATRKQMFTARGGNPFSSGPADQTTDAPSNTGSQTASKGKFKSSMGKS